MNFKEILEIMIEKNISDMFIHAGSAVRGRIDSRVELIEEGKIELKDVEKFIRELVSERDKGLLESKRSCEFAIWHKDRWRFRVGVFYQQNSPSIVIRKIDLCIPTFEQLKLPVAVLENFCKQRRGLVLLTGITGSGKSTTIASMTEYINVNMGKHILTIEDPVEFIFQDKKCMINQREIGVDVDNYADALRQLAIHSPDVIYIGNIRDAETCHAALTAAEIGVLVFSTLHTVNATSTIERIINFFPPHQHNFILEQLSFLLKGVISLRLIPRATGAGLVPAYEVLSGSPSISRLLRENKLWEIPKYIAEGDVYGMKSFHQCLLELIEKGDITPEIALEYADKKGELEMELRNRGIM